MRYDFFSLPYHHVRGCVSGCFFCVFVNNSSEDLCSDNEVVQTGLNLPVAGVNRLVSALSKLIVSSQQQEEKAGKLYCRLRITVVNYVQQKKLKKGQSIRRFSRFNCWLGSATCPETRQVGCWTRFEHRGCRNHVLWVAEPDFLIWKSMGRDNNHLITNCHYWLDHCRLSVVAENADLNLN